MSNLTNEVEITNIVEDTPVIMGDTPIIIGDTPIKTKKVKKTPEEKQAEQEKKLKEKEQKKKEKEENARKKKEEKDEQAKKKKQQEEFETLEKTHWFRVPQKKSHLFSYEERNKLKFMLDIYDIISELAPELLEDTRVKDAYNDCINTIKKYISYITSYQLSNESLYSWFAKENKKDTYKKDTEYYIKKNYNANLSYFTNLNMIYTHVSYKTTNIDYDFHINNVYDICDKYYILYDLINPHIYPKAKAKVENFENAKKVKQNLQLIANYKEKILNLRSDLKWYEKEIRRIDIEGSTIKELFGE